MQRPRRHSGPISGAHLTKCDVCGVPWYRRLLRRRRDGLLACPEDISERDPVTLTEGNAAAVPMPRGPRWDGGASGVEEVTFILVDEDGNTVVTEEGTKIDPTRV